jgi:CRP/FNR family transcriptional regulator
MKLLENLLHKETVFSSEAKIADLIANNAKVFQYLKNNEIASILNITPETLSRTLTKLKKEEIITLNEHVVTILNQNALQNIIETNSMKKSVSI